MLWLIRVAGEVLFADVLLLPNGMSKVGYYVLAFFTWAARLKSTSFRHPLGLAYRTNHRRLA